MKEVDLVNLGRTGVVQNFMYTKNTWKEGEKENLFSPVNRGYDEIQRSLDGEGGELGLQSTETDCLFQTDWFHSVY